MSQNMLLLAAIHGGIPVSTVATYIGLFVAEISSWWRWYMHLSAYELAHTVVKLI